MFETFKMTHPPTQISYHPDFEANCSIGKEKFQGCCFISYEPTNLLIEFESFEKWLRKEMEKEPITIEESARRIFHALIAELGDIPLQVTVSARTTVHASVEAHYSTEKWRVSCENMRGVL